MRCTNLFHTLQLIRTIPFHKLRKYSVLNISIYFTACIGKCAFSHAIIMYGDVIPKIGPRNNPFMEVCFMRNTVMHFIACVDDYTLLVMFFKILFNGKWLACDIAIFYYLCWWMWISSRFCVRSCDSRHGFAHRMTSDFVLELPSTRVDSLLRRTAQWMLSYKRLIETPEMRRWPTCKAPYAGISRKTSPVQPGFYSSVEA